MYLWFKHCITRLLWISCLFIKNLINLSQIIKNLQSIESFLKHGPSYLKARGARPGIIFLNLQNVSSFIFHFWKLSNSQFRMEKFKTYFYLISFWVNSPLQLKVLSQHVSSLHRLIFIRDKFSSLKYHRSRYLVQQFITRWQISITSKRTRDYCALVLIEICLLKINIATSLLLSYNLQL